MSNIRHFYSNNSEWQRITGRGAGGLPVLAK